MPYLLKNKRILFLFSLILFSLILFFYLKFNFYDNKSYKINEIISLEIKQGSLKGRPTGKAINLYQRDDFNLVKIVENKVFYVSHGGDFDYYYYEDNNFSDELKKIFNDNQIWNLNNKEYFTTLVGKNAVSTKIVNLKTDIGYFTFTFDTDLMENNTLSGEKYDNFENFKKFYTYLYSNLYNNGDEYYSDDIMIIVVNDMYWVKNKDKYPLIDFDLSRDLNENIITDKNYYLQKKISKNSVFRDKDGDVFVVYYIPILDF